jgi:transcriptional regulator with XRE-family HTH domain
MTRRPASADSLVTATALRLSRTLKSLRVAKGLTQAELAHKAHVTVETVARLERVVRGGVSANSNPSLETIVRLAHALGVEPRELFQ